MRHIHDKDMEDPQEQQKLENNRFNTRDGVMHIGILQVYSRLMLQICLKAFLFDKAYSQG